GGRGRLRSHPPRRPPAPGPRPDADPRGALRPDRLPPLRRTARRPVPAGQAQDVLTGPRLRTEPAHPRRPLMATKTTSSARKTPVRKAAAPKAPAVQAEAPAAAPPGPKPKKSVALSGIVAG